MGGSCFKCGAGFELDTGDGAQDYPYGARCFYCRQLFCNRHAHEHFGRAGERIHELEAEVEVKTRALLTIIRRRAGSVRDIAMPVLSDEDHKRPEEEGAS